MALITDELPRVSRLLKQFKIMEPDLPVYATTNRIYIKKTGNKVDSPILDSIDIKDMIERIGLPPQMPTETMLEFLRRIDREIKRGNTLNPKLRMPEKIIRLSIWVCDLVDYEAASIMEAIYQQSIILGVDEACKLYISLMTQETRNELISKRKSELTEMQILE